RDSISWPRDARALAREPLLDQAAGDRLRRRELHLAAGDLLAREPADVLELPVAHRGLAGPPARGESEHQRGRERPRLRGAVAHLAPPPRGPLEPLAGDRLFEALPRLDEAGQRAVAPRRPGRLAAEHRAVAVLDEHDHDGVGARVMLGAAVRAAAHVPRVG